MVAVAPTYISWVPWVLLFFWEKVLFLVTEVFCDSYNFSKNLHNLFAESGISMHFTYGSIKKIVEVEIPEGNDDHTQSYCSP